MSRLDSIIELGLARIDNAVEFAIWKHTAFEGGIEGAMKHRPVYPAPPTMEIPIDALKGLYLQALYPESELAGDYCDYGMRWAFSVFHQGRRV